MPPSPLEKRISDETGPVPSGGGGASGDSTTETAGDPAPSSSPAEVGPAAGSEATPLRWFDLPPEVVRYARENLYGEKEGYRPGQFGLMDEVGEWNIRVLVSDGKISQENIDNLRHRRQVTLDASARRAAAEAEAARVEALGRVTSQPQFAVPQVDDGESFAPTAPAAAQEVPSAASPDSAPAAAPASPEADPSAAIAAAESWEELAAAVEAIPEIQGSRQLFTGEEMAGVVREIAAGRLDSIYATRTYGIRGKLEGFILAENAAHAAAAPAPAAGAGADPTSPAPAPESDSAPANPVTAPAPEAPVPPVPPARPSANAITSS